MRKAILFVNLHKENAEAAAAKITAELEKRDTEAEVFSFNGRPGAPVKGKWDIAFSFGGDGTVLYTARTLAAGGTPIIPLQLGTLGFLASVEIDEWLSVYEKWLDNKAIISKRCMFDIQVERNGIAYTSTGLNDVVISSLGIAKLIRLAVKTEVQPGEFADLGYYRSDGLIIATPTGSTAYSMAAGGPILDPEMEARILCPICPFSLSNRPLALPSRQTLHVTVDKEQRSGVLLTVDGQDAFVLSPGDKIIVKHSPHYAVLVTAGRTAYYSALKNKLKWDGKGEGNA